MVANGILSQSGVDTVNAGGTLQVAKDAALGGVGMNMVSPDVGRTFVRASEEGTAKPGRQPYACYGLTGEVRSGKNDIGVTGGVRISF